MEPKKENRMGALIRIAVLSWSAALLTASYAGLLPKMDPTFIATVFTASAATFGVNTMKKGDDDDNKRNDSVPAVTAVEPTPVPVEPTVQPVFNPEPVAESVAESVAEPVAESDTEGAEPSRYSDTQA